MYHVVIIDDEPRICEGLEKLYPWNSQGFEVVGAFTDSAKALSFINERDDIDIVMTDIEMPGLNGIEISNLLKDRKIAVIFFSAYQRFEYARSAILNQVVDYLIKPMSYDAISECLRRVRKRLDATETHEIVPGADARASFDIQSFVLNYIDANYATATLEEAAALSHYTPAYLSSAFKQASGRTFISCLTAKRMKTALRLLRGGDTTLDETAAQVGYLNPKNLSRNFKEYYGITPGEFRKGAALKRHCGDMEDAGI